MAEGGEGGGRREGRRTNEEKIWKQWNSHASPTRESTDSQQHVLLVLLKHGPDVLEDVWLQEVYAAVYYVAHERARLLHIMQDLN